MLETHSHTSHGERGAHFRLAWDIMMIVEPQLTLFQAMFDLLEADIVVMQETKIQRKDLRDDMVLVPGWDVFFSLPRHKKGDLDSSKTRALTNYLR
jgi:hypothetical protein